MTSLSDSGIDANSRQFRLLAEAIPQMVWTTGGDGSCDYVNRNWCEYTGKSPEESAGAGWREAVHPDDRERCGSEGSESIRIRRANGAYRWFQVRAEPLDGGRRLRVATDIEAEREAELSRRWLERVASNTRDIIFVLDIVRNRNVYSNRSLLDVLGYDPKEFLEAEEILAKAIAPEDLAAAERFYGAMRDAAPGEIRLLTHRTLHADGSIRWIENRVTPFSWDEEGRVTEVIGVASDITLSKQAEQAVRESEDRFRTLADNIAQLAWMADETGWIFWYNRRWFDYTGTTLEEMQGWGWQKVHHPDHLERVLEKFRRHIETGEAWEDTFPLRGTDGVYRWFLSRAIPIRDEAGRVLRWFGTNTDVTAQREAEEALREADRRKNEFLAMLAHELRNPLGPVRNAVQILRMVGPQAPPLQRARDMIDRQVTHMARLIDDLMDVSRVARGTIRLHRERCDLARIVRQTAEDYRSTLEAGGLTLSVDVPDVPLWMDGDPIRLAQIVGNLLHNAGKFTEPGGRADLRVSAQGETAVVSLRDTGGGMDEALLARLFEPFSQADQSLDRSKGGLGLGLALVKGLAELHGGSIEAHSEGSGRGSTFTLRLPLAEPAAAGEPAGTAAAAADGLRVLVIEDNADAAESLQMLLSLMGHEAEVTFDGESGVEKARALRPDVVLSDLGLPGAMDGYAVARTLRADPSLASTPLIAISGYGQEEDRELSREAGFDRHLVKPADFAELTRALAALPRRR